MKCQIRLINGEIFNKEMTTLDIVDELRKETTMKVSFELTNEGSRIALYPDASFQIFGGLVNFPALDY